MKFPETAEDVEQEILISSYKYEELGDLRIRQLIHILRKANPEIVAEGVIRVFENGGGADKYSQDQKFAGKVLESINPKSEKDAMEVPKRVLKNWDRSVEQLPFWLRANYGIDKMKDAFAELQLNEHENDKLKIIKWWLQLTEANA